MINLNEKLYDFLLKLPRKNLIHIMDDALDIMQQYNGRSNFYCICRAMGWKERNDGYAFLPTPLSMVKKYTENINPLS